MKIINQEAWDAGRARNADGYGKAIYEYAKKWAQMMEVQISNGKELKNIAIKMSHDADSKGITGDMYECAVKILSVTWEHGEELRKWHNLYIKMDDEGEEING